MPRGDKTIGIRMRERREKVLRITIPQIVDKLKEYGLHVTSGTVRFWENGERRIQEDQRPAIAKVYGIPESELIPYSIGIEERCANYVRKIISRSKLNLVFIFSDLEFNEIFYEGKSYIEKLHAGGALHAGVAAYNNNMVPIICAAVGKNEDNEGDFISWLNTEHAEIITSFIEIRSEVTNCSPLYFTGKSTDDRKTSNRPDTYPTDLDPPNIKKIIQMSGLSSKGIIFVHSFQLFRIMQSDKNIFELSSEEREKRKNLISNYMDSFLFDEINDRPFVVLQLAPPFYFHTRFTQEEISIINLRCDMMDIDLRIALNVLNKESGKNADIEHNEINEECLNKIIKLFLGRKEGDTLLIRFGGEDYLNKLLILQRSKENKVIYLKEDGNWGYANKNIYKGNDTGYKDFFFDEKLKKIIIENIKDEAVQNGLFKGMKRIGFEEKLLFEYLSIIMKNREKIRQGSLFRENNEL